MKQKVLAVSLAISLLLCASFTMLTSLSESTSGGVDSQSIIDPNKEEQIYWNPAPEGGYALYNGLLDDAAFPTVFTKPVEGTIWSTDSKGSVWDASKALVINGQVSTTWSKYVYTSDDYDIDSLKATFKWGDNTATSEITEKQSNPNLSTEAVDGTDYLSGTIVSDSWVSEDNSLGATIDYKVKGKDASLYIDLKLYAGENTSFDKVYVLLEIKLKADGKSTPLQTKASNIVFAIDVDQSVNSGVDPVQPIPAPHELTINIVHGYCSVAETEDLTTYISSNQISDSSIPKRLYSGDMIDSGKFIRIVPNTDYLGTLSDGTPKLKSISIMAGNTSVEYSIVERTSTLIEYAFVMPDHDTQLTVEFNAHEVSFSGDHCTATFSAMRGSITANDRYFFQGEEVIIKPTADAGYRVDSWIVQPETIQIANNRFIMGNSDVSLGATLSQSHTVSVGAVSGGSIQFSKTTAFPGEIVTVTAIPDEGYDFSELSSTPAVTIDGRSFVMPDSDIVVSAVFEPTKLLKTELSTHGAFTVVDVTVVEGLGANLQDPSFLIVGKYDGDIVINVYTHISGNNTHTERVELSTLGLNEIWIHLVDGYSSNLTEYYAQVVVNG